MKDNMFQPSCGHHHLCLWDLMMTAWRLKHVVLHDFMLINLCTVALTFILWYFYLLALRDAFSKVLILKTQIVSIYNTVGPPPHARISYLWISEIKEKICLFRIFGPQWEYVKFFFCNNMLAAGHTFLLKNGKWLADKHELITNHLEPLLTYIESIDFDRL